ncbi:MAG: ATP synthase F0 subunit B [Acidobacteria bacterium]|nr:ATP synthase F0 subunit B [Acidobacteriota bacterium]
MRLRRARAGTWGLVAAFALFLCSLAFAQKSSDAAERSARQAPAASASENSGGDPMEQFRHSASVRGLARMTGLSVEAAYWLALCLNFAVVAGVIGWASKKNLPALFRNRTASIQKAVDEARRASEDARRRLADVESRLSRLDEEINQMRATADKEAATEEERIRAAAAEDARRIIESAEQEIAAATKAARRELTAHAADLAVTLAAKQIRVDRPTDQALVRSFAQQIADGAAGKKA